MDSIEEHQKLRKSYLDKVRSLEPFDAAFQIIIYNKNHREIHGPFAQEELSMYEAFPSLCSDKRVDSMRRAEGLFNASTEMYSFINNAPNKESIMNRLKAVHPGFSESIYSSIIGRVQYMAVK